MSGRNPDDARHEDCGPAEVDDVDPLEDDDTAPCGWCDARIDLDDHLFKPHPESGDYVCDSCRADDPAGSKWRGPDTAAAVAAGGACAGCGHYPVVCECDATGLEGAFAAVLVELDATHDTIETPAPACPTCAGQGYTIESIDYGAFASLCRVPCCINITKDSS